jgi:hypothetical protein
MRRERYWKSGRGREELKRILDSHGPFAKALGKGIGQSLESNPHELA